MQKVVLGRTGLSATVMGLGGGGDSRLGRAGGERDAASVGLVRAALEPGAHVVLSGTGSVEHLLENVHSLARPPLPERDRARLIELFRGVEDVSVH